MSEFKTEISKMQGVEISDIQSEVYSIPFSGMERTEVKQTEAIINDTKIYDQQNIDDIFEAIKKLMCAEGRNICAIGEQISRLKALNKGVFTVDCKKRLPFSIDKADKYMRVNNRFGKNENGILSCGLSVSGLMECAQSKYSDDDICELINAIREESLKPKYTMVKKFLDARLNIEASEESKITFTKNKKMLSIKKIIEFLSEDSLEDTIKNASAKDLNDFKTCLNRVNEIILKNNQEVSSIA